MLYLELCQVYDELENHASRLEKTEILAKFLSKLKKDGDFEIMYLLEGKAFPDYDEREFGISEQLCIKAMTKSSGISSSEIVEKWRKIGDLGEVAEEVISRKSQNTLFSKKLTTEKVLENLRKLPTLVGRGTVDKKLSFISELLTSASGIEAKYIIRTLLNSLRIGVASGTLRDAIVSYCFSPETIKEKKEIAEVVQDAYDKINDFVIIFKKANVGIDELEKIKLVPGNPIKPMLALKTESVEDGFERVGKPAVFEYKYDGFRMIINKTDNGEIKIFTRRLDNVTRQFPEVVKYVKEHVKLKSFILDCEAVGYDPVTFKYTPFESVSQRIKRKHNIDELVKKLPIELNVFDLLYYNGKSLIGDPFIDRTKLLRKVIKNKEYKIRTSKQLITDDVSLAEKFYHEALNENQEGVMIKNMNSKYSPGGRVGHMLKLKPAENDFDLVITGAEYGKGKRAGYYSTFILSCINNGEYLEVGRASGLKEKSELGLSFEEVTKKLKPYIIREEGRMVWVKPKLVVTVVYQNLQKSPTYKSGYALRFPRIVRLRPDRKAEDIASLKEIEREYKR